MDIRAGRRWLDIPWTKGSAFSLTFHDYESLRLITRVSFGEPLQTGDVWIASKIASRMGLMRGTGGVTPHIRTSKALARFASSSLSLTVKSYLVWVLELDWD